MFLALPTLATMEGDRETDADLVRAMAEGDTGALERFYERYADRTLSLLARIVGAGGEAEELLERVFVELWRRAPDYDPGRASVSAWVMALARNRALGAAGARGRRAGGGSRSASRAAEELSEDQRQVLELAYFEGLSQREIAERIGLPIETVRSRILAGMRALRSARAGGGAGGAR